jgi:hypothetical protein
MSKTACVSALIVTILALGAGSAHALEWDTHGAVGAEIGLGSVFTGYSPNSESGRGVLLTGLRYGYDLNDEWAAQLVLRQWWLPGPDHATMPGLGVRYEPYRTDHGRVFVDAAIGPAWTSTTWAFAFDLAGGYEFQMPDAPGVGVGPVFRYGEVVHPDPRVSGDGRGWSLGVSFAYHIGRGQAAAAERHRNDPGPVRPFVFHVPDTDHDGVTDDADQCRDVATGRHPDPMRPGCPESDEDGDGIPDDVDACPVTKPGERPDPKRAGCPVADSDEDSIPDDEDHCPNKPGVPSMDPNLNGCPEPSKPAAPKSKRSEPDLPALAPAHRRAIKGPSGEPSSEP